MHLPGSIRSGDCSLRSVGCHSRDSGACLTLLSSIGNLLGEKDANRAGVAANAALLLSILLALFLRSVSIYIFCYFHVNDGHLKVASL